MKELLDLISTLEQEAAEIQVQGRTLTIGELARLRAIHKALPLMRQAASHFPCQDSQNNLITYKIVSDIDGKLKSGARTACNFWNRYVAPRYSIVIRLGLFTANSNTIARAYKPSMRAGVTYGVVEFNTKYLNRFKANEIAGTVVHEIGHTLGFGWDDWMDLFDLNTGMFYPESIERLGALENMVVETDYGPGTELSHWDEERFDRELMTGIQDSGEYVLPVTIDVMALFGHRVVEKLTERKNLAQLLDEVSQLQFTRREEAKSLDLDFYEETEILEEIPHRDNHPANSA